MAQYKSRKSASRKSAATNDRNFRTFLLMAQFEAEAIGARITQARKEAGLTQEQLADMAEGFSKRSLQDYESGVTVPYKHVREIAALTGKNVEWIMHGPPTDPPPSVEQRLGRIEDVLDRMDERSEAVRQRALTELEAIDLSGLSRDDADRLERAIAALR